MYGITSTNSTAPPTTSTVTLPPTTITVTPTAAATPTIACAFWDKDFVADEFELYNIGGGWVTDGGAKLKKEEKGRKREGRRHLGVTLYGGPCHRYFFQDSFV